MSTALWKRPIQQKAETWFQLNSPATPCSVWVTRVILKRSDLNLERNCLILSYKLADVGHNPGGRPRPTPNAVVYYYTAHWPLGIMLNLPPPPSSFLIENTRELRIDRWVIMNLSFGKEFKISIVDSSPLVVHWMPLKDGEIWNWLNSKPTVQIVFLDTNCA